MIVQCFRASSLVTESTPIQVIVVKVRLVARLMILQGVLGTQKL